MKKLMILAVVASASIAMAVAGCGGNDCEKAGDIFLACVSDADTTTTTGTAPACEGIALCGSLCVIASEAIICDLADPDVDADALKTYNDCTADCASGS